MSWNNLSLRNKLFIILIVISIVPSVTIYLLSQHFMMSSQTSQSSRAAATLLASVARDVDEYVTEINQSLNALYVTYEFQQFTQADADDYVAQAYWAAGFKTLVQNLLQTHPEITGLLYLDQWEKVYYQSNAFFLNYSYRFQEDPFYSMESWPQTPSLSVPHQASYMINDQQDVISYFFPIRNLRTGAYHAGIIIELKTDYIRQLIASSPEVSSQLLLYDQATASFVTASSSDLHLPQALAELLHAKLNGRQADAMTLQTKHNNNRYELYAYPLGYGQWQLVWLASLDELNSGVRGSLRALLIVTAVTLCAALIIAYPLMHLVWRPMQRLKTSMDQLSRGIHIPVPSSSQRDEISYLIRVFNRMLGNMKELEQEVIASHLKEKERELLQLQAQINPHFLFNTLETIDEYASRGDSTAVEQMIQSLSKMTRYSARVDRGFAALAEEVAYVQEYLRLHSWRNDTTIKTNWQIDPRCLQENVMKLSVQPFVENAIKYGWEPDMELSALVFTITISVRREEQKLIFSVHNTGKTMSKQLVQKLQLLASTDMMTKDDFFERHTGIYNVFRRLFLAYGKALQVQISSEEGEGTSIGWCIDQGKL